MTPRGVAGGAQDAMALVALLATTRRFRGGDGTVSTQDMRELHMFIIRLFNTLLVFYQFFLEIILKCDSNKIATYI